IAHIVHRPTSRLLLFIPVSPLFRKQKMSGVEASIRARETKTRVTTEKLVQERRTGTPKTKQKNRRSWNSRFECIVISSVLNSTQARVTCAAQPIYNSAMPS